MDNGVTIERSLDLSNAISATLSFDYDEKNGNETIQVRIWDGTQYNTRATLDGDGVATTPLRQLNVMQMPLSCSGLVAAIGVRTKNMK